MDAVSRPLSTTLRATARAALVGAGGRTTRSRARTAPRDGYPHIHPAYYDCGDLDLLKGMWKLYSFQIRDSLMCILLTYADSRSIPA